MIILTSVAEAQHLIFEGNDFSLLHGQAIKEYINISYAKDSITASFGDKLYIISSLVSDPFHFDHLFDICRGEVSRYGYSLYTKMSTKTRRVGLFPV